VLLESGRAVGVEFEQEGQVRTLKARGEIILCAGAIGSPHLLLRSGIGSAEQLRASGIAPQVNLAGVGRNLQDHFAATIMMRTRNSESYGLSMRALPRGIWTVLNYALRRRGALASNVFEAHGFIRTLPALDRPDVQIIFVPAHRNASGFPIPLGHGFGINIALLRPASRGSVALGSPDPRAAPVIDPAFLSTAADLPPLINGFNVARAILNAPAFASARAHEILPGPRVRTDQEIESFVRESGFTVFHPVGTCRMGSDANAVVDPTLRVRGTQCLRVVDASVFPMIVGGNTNAAVVMVAEKAADLIRGKSPPPPFDPSSKQQGLAMSFSDPVIEDIAIE
jgi:choline dehydrogenase-like flavoprotein